LLKIDSGLATVEERAEFQALNTRPARLPP
jgi:hypothetical protein